MPVSNFYKNVNSTKLAGHPGYEFERHNGNSKVIEISHHENNRLQNGKISRFHKLTSNPNKNDTKLAYASRQPFIVDSSSLRHKQKDWAFNESDIPFVENVKKKKPM